MNHRYLYRRFLCRRRGSASALIVLMLVLLVFFGVLSVVTAAADNRLAGRRAEWVRNYYETDKKALQVLGDLNNYASMAPPAVSANRIALIALMQKRLADFRDVEPLEADLVAEEDFRFRVWNGNQAIEVGLRLNGPVQVPSGSPYSLDILRWSAWQKPFDYEGGPGGVWKGDLT